MQKRWDIQWCDNFWFSLGIHIDHKGPFITIHLPLILFMVGCCHIPGFPFSLRQWLTTGKPRQYGIDTKGRAWFLDEWGLTMGTGGYAVENQEEIALDKSDVIFENFVCQHCAHKWQPKERYTIDTGCPNCDTEPVLISFEGTVLGIVKDKYEVVQ